MLVLLKLGRLFYGIGIASLGVHQIIIKDFRADILPPFPAWAHQYTVFPILAGIALILAGLIISGLINIKFIDTRRICLYVGFCFIVLIITCHLPYILFMSPYPLSRLDMWFGVGEAIAYSGGAFIIAGSFSEEDHNNERRPFESLLEKLIPPGTIFYSILILLFGTSHFVFTDFVSTMVPAWFGARIFWTYLVGVLLIGAGIALILNIWVKTVALLLAVMIFLFFIFFHVPDAIANPAAGGGNEIVRAIVALLFTGIALVITATKAIGKQN